MTPEYYKLGGLIIVALIGSNGLGYLVKLLLNAKVRSGERAEKGQSDSLKKQVNGLESEKDQRQREALAALKAERDETRAVLKTERDEARRQQDQAIRSDIQANRTEICHIQKDFREFQDTWSREAATSTAMRKALFAKLDTQGRQIDNIQDKIGEFTEAQATQRKSTN